ncbi:MAG: TolC family protein, partial [bacterium]|nr:TolC family protein [bacterium]
LCLVGGTHSVWGQETGEQVSFDLAACIQRALQVHPSIDAAEADLQIAEAQLSQARAARFLPKFDLKWMVGPSPEARGDVFNGDSNWQNLSIFTRTEISLIQPLYTFGKLGAAQDAASGGILVRQAGLEKSRQDLELQVAEAYYLLLLANELRALADEARDELGKARQAVDEKLEEDTGEYTYTDLYRIDRFMFDVEENAHKVENGQEMAQAALRMLMGLPREQAVVLAAETLEPVEVEIQLLEHYLMQAGNRPDLRQLQAGIGVRAAQVKAARSDLFPQFFLGGGFKHGYAPNRDKQSNPFVKDDFNFTSLGAVVGLQQSLSFGGTTAKLKQARLEKKKLEYQGRLARKGTELEVERIYRKLREAEANVASAIKARKATRRWFVSARSGFNAGLEPSGELIDAVKEYGIIRAKYYHAVFEFNRAWAALQKATGNWILK